MNFEEILMRAKEGNLTSIEQILSQYRPLLIKYAVVNGRFDEDLYQELTGTLLICIHRFQIVK